MRKILTIAFLLTISLQSCDFIMLSAKERKIKGIWEYSNFFGKAILALNANKDLDLYAGFNFGLEGAVHFTGKWEVVEDHLIIELAPNPDVQIKGDDYIEDFVNKHKDKFEGIISSGKIIKVDQNKLILEEGTSYNVWKHATTKDLTKMKKRFNKIAKEDS